MDVQHKKAVQQMFPAFYAPTQEYALPDFEKYMLCKPQEKKEKVLQEHPVIVLPVNEKVLQVNKEVLPVNENKVQVNEKPNNIVDSVNIIKQTNPVVKNTEFQPTKKILTVKKILNPQLENNRKPRSLLSHVANKVFASVSEEMDERARIAAHITTCKKELKAAYKLTHAEVDEIVSDLMTVNVLQEPITSCFGRVFTNLALCCAYSFYYKKTIVLVQLERKTQLTFFYDGDGCQTVLAFDSLKTAFRSLEGVPEGYLEMHDIKKPLKAVSHYKTDELASILQSIENKDEKKRNKDEKKRNKQELYTAITHYCLLGRAD